MNVLGLFSPIIKQYISKIGGSITGDVLDVGCGDKPYRSAFTNAKSYIGLDRPSIIDSERTNASSRKSSIDVVGYAESLPFNGESFDAVIATQLIEHLARPNLFFAECARVLRSEGLLIITFPMISILHEEPYDYFRYTEHGIKVLCEDQDLKVEKIEKMGGGWLMIGYLIRDFLYKNASKATNFISYHLLKCMGTSTYNLLSRLDIYNWHPEGTLNYLITAKKKKVPSQASGDEGL